MHCEARCAYQGRGEWCAGVCEPLQLAAAGTANLAHAPAERMHGCVVCVLDSLPAVAAALTRCCAVPPPPASCRLMRERERAGVCSVLVSGFADTPEEVTHEEAA